jgi:RHS repeat-associated protein
VLDNKGNPVKQYEPFFSSTFEYEDEAELVEWGVTPILRYDAIGRRVRTDLPNGTFSKVVFDPWQEARFDPNDTVLESAWYEERKGLDPANDPEGRAAKLAAAHADTPAVMHLDALGRTFRAIEDNGPAGKYATTTTLDVEGNPLVVTDARGNKAQRNVFGMGKHKLRQKSCDAGERWSLAEVGGKPLRAWDDRGFVQRPAYDAARRATHLFVTPPGAAEMLVERTIYGEALGAGAATKNQRSKVYQHFDGAGMVTSAAYDFKGNLLGSDRRLAQEYHAQVNWSALAALTDPAATAAAADAMLEAEVLASRTLYDALNRAVSLTAPDQSIVLPIYNEASLLGRVLVRLGGAADETTFVDDIDYDAKGQRERIVHGKGATTTTYTYDPLTFRMTQLKTTRASDGAVLQNLVYTYDPVANITELKDSAQQKVFFDNDVVLLKMAYVYDALYRLAQATGREQAGGLADVQRDRNDVPLFNLPHTNDTQAVRNYTESYQYDPVGNIIAMIHESGAAATSWTRRYNVDAGSNRLLATNLPGDDAGQYSAKYGYDAHGSMTSMPHLASVTWSYRDEMLSADKGGGGMVYFAYNAAGQRVRKVWEHGGVVEERVYVEGYEVYRKRGAPGVVLERQSLHVMDGVKRVALVETTTRDTSAGGAFQQNRTTRFQLGNHLGSAMVEVDEAGAVVSFEEYHPYGTSAYRAGTSAAEVSLKRYRYTGKERDEETGLYYHGARYYAPWLGRWTAADPIGLQAGPNLYRYCSDNPMTFVDPNGTDELGTALDWARYAITPLDLLTTNKEVHEQQSQGFINEMAKAGENIVEGVKNLPAFMRAVKEAIPEPSNLLTTATPPKMAEAQAADTMARLQLGAALGTAVAKGVAEPFKQVVVQGKILVDPKSTPLQQGQAAAGVAFNGSQALGTIATVVEGVAELRGAMSLGKGFKLPKGGIAGQAKRAGTPLYHPVPNPGGEVRTLPQALKIAEDAGVNVDPETFAFKLHEGLPSNVGAEYGKTPRIDPRGGMPIIEMNKFFYRLPDGRIMIRVNPNILSSDVNIVGTLGHETHEAMTVEAEFFSQGGRMRADALHGLVNPETGTAHIEAWDFANEVVRKLRGGK